MLDYLVPGILLGTSLLALRKRADSYDILLSGAKDGLELVLRILPTLIVLMTAVSMFRSSGGSEILGKLLAPVLKQFGIPEECAVLVLVRPISGSAALAVGSDLMARYGVNSPIGRTAAVMLGSTETTFYVISVYLGAAGVKRSRYILPASLFADFVGFVMAGVSVRWLFP